MEERPTIQLATMADLPEIIALDEALFSWYGAAEDPTIIARRLAVFPEGFVVLKGGDVVVGYASTEKWFRGREPALDEDPALTHNQAGTILCITTLAVRESYQGQGFGRFLLNYLLDLAQAQGCTAIVLETAHAASFYLRHGFVTIGEREQRGITLIILQYSLKILGG